MSYLYVDNFRGFKDTLIPLEDVNFLVGENSTGKTSILSLLTIISNHMFWFKPDFNMEGVEFGGFKDIVSINSADRSYFKIGFIGSSKDRYKKKEVIRYQIFLIKFIEKNGIPVVSQLSSLQRDLELCIKITDKCIYYKLSDVNIDLESINDVISVFNNWKKEKSFKDKLSRINLPEKYSRENILAFGSHLIEEKEEKRTKKKYLYRLMRLYDLPHVHWIAPIRTKPLRIYDQYRVKYTPEGDHTPIVIKRILSGRDSKKFLKYINNFGKKSGLFKSVSVNEIGSHFELNIILNKPINISNVGYGISQCLPVIIDLFMGYREDVIFIIQQPEIHLHPKAQAALGDLFYHYAKNKKRKFIIETHSDYIIDRYRMNFRKNKKYIGINSQVLFFNRNNKGNTVYPIDINKKGDYSENQPQAFRDFFIKEEMSLLGLK